MSALVVIKHLSVGKVIIKWNGPVQKLLSGAVINLKKRLIIQDWCYIITLVGVVVQRILAAIDGQSPVNRITLFPVNVEELPLLHISIRTTESPALNGVIGKAHEIGRLAIRLIHVRVVHVLEP